MYPHFHAYMNIIYNVPHTYTRYVHACSDLGDNHSLPYLLRQGLSLDSELWVQLSGQPVSSGSLLCPLPQHWVFLQHSSLLLTSDRHFTSWALSSVLFFYDFQVNDSWFVKIILSSSSFFMAFEPPGSFSLPSTWLMLWICAFLKSLPCCNFVTFLNANFSVWSDLLPLVADIPWIPLPPCPLS